MSTVTNNSFFIAVNELLVTNRRANSAAPAHRAREARGTALRRADLGCGRSPLWLPIINFRLVEEERANWEYINNISFSKGDSR